MRDMDKPSDRGESHLFIVSYFKLSDTGVLARKASKISEKSRKSGGAHLPWTKIKYCLARCLQQAWAKNGTNRSAGKMSRKLPGIIDNRKEIKKEYMMERKNSTKS